MDTNTAKPGWKTSEFWLAAFAMVAGPLVPVLDQVVSNTISTTATHNAGNAWGALAPALIASVYAIGRSYVKQPAPIPVLPATVQTVNNG